jgi:predicted SnoaL-like aldol condensation-catalyzing enzyme
MTIDIALRDLKAWLALATLMGGLVMLSDFAPGRVQGVDAAGSLDLGAKARQVMIDIFLRKDATTIERSFTRSFVQHDPTIADGLPGLKSFAAEVARSPAAKITIYRTLIDGDMVMLHSKYEGLRGVAAPLIAFDLFRFQDGKIVEHWGGQGAETAPNLSGHTQVDGPTAVVDREKTESNRALVRDFKQVVTVDLHFNRVGEFIEGDNYTQHASNIGDGTARLRARVSEVAKPGVVPVLQPRRYVADGNFVLALVEARTEPHPTANYDLFRVENGKIVEHWDVLSPIPPRAQWKNSNGPF